MRLVAQRSGLDIGIDSAGTAAYHIGASPDDRAQAAALRHGADISDLRGRQVTAADFHHFTHIFALDASNLANLRRLSPADATAKLSLLMDAVPGQEGMAVADPYYGADAGFEVTWSEVYAAAEALAGRLSI